MQIPQQAFQQLKSIGSGKFLKGIYNIMFSIFKLLNHLKIKDMTQDSQSKAGLCPPHPPPPPPQPMQLY
jgi:hypothetical protein